MRYVKFATKKKKKKNDIHIYGIYSYSYTHTVLQEVMLQFETLSV